jgi:hypothetical protein
MSFSKRYCIHTYLLLPRNHSRELASMIALVEFYSFVLRKLRYLSTQNEHCKQFNKTLYVRA